MNAALIDFIDLGDATRETKQLWPQPVYLDSLFGLGIRPDLG
jgi:hypothetical protein